MKKTTKKDFKLFQEECRDWIGIFGLKDWGITFKHQPLEGQEGTCEGNTLDHNVDMSLEDELDDEHKNDVYIKETALHEVFELLFIKFWTLATSRSATESELTEERHRMIHTLTNVLFPLKKHLIKKPK